MHPLLEDPWVAAQIDAAIEKHRPALTPRQIEVFREKMAWTFANNPTAQQILARARPGADERSGERAKDDVSVSDAEGQSEKGKAG